MQNAMCAGSEIVQNECHTVMFICISYKKYGFLCRLAAAELNCMERTPRRNDVRLLRCMEN